MSTLQKLPFKPALLAGLIGVALGFPAAQAAYYVPAGAKSSTPGDVVFLDQGWNNNNTNNFREPYYYTPQGSRLMPYSWFLALEQVGSTAKFTDPDNMRKFGWLVDGKSQLNPDGLPIGFTKDPANLPGTGQWVGLNCAACHTGEMTYQGKKIRIDGGSTHADLGQFLTALAGAVKATRMDLSPQGVPGEKFKRFAAGVYGHAPSQAELTQLIGSFAEFDVKLEGEIWMRTPPSVATAGPGRVDALNQIINALAVFDLHEPDNLRSVTAPVSYPFVWIAPKLDYVQWAPVASSPISRNAGEVMGVFGAVDFTNKTNPLASSVLLKDLYDMEDWLDQLAPPPWPENLFGKVDPAKVAQGKKLFDRDCLSCHNMPPYRMTPKEVNAFGKQYIQINRTPFQAVGTDSVYTMDLISRTSKTGVLAPSLFNNQPVTSGAGFFLTSVGAVLKQAFVDQKVSQEDAVKYNGYRFCPPTQPAQKNVYCTDTNVGGLWATPGDAAVSLKSGPLFGVWASAPFLHNGSVPNLYELLSPPSERSTVFWAGSREFEPAKVGFKSTEKELSAEERKNLFLFDTRLPGNSNRGHNYPATPYSAEERIAVIEYLKNPGTDWRP